jgi:hypothetical protein
MPQEVYRYYWYNLEKTKIPLCLWFAAVYCTQKRSQSLISNIQSLSLLIIIIYPSLSFLYTFFQFAEIIVQAKVK